MRTRSKGKATAASQPGENSGGTSGPKTPTKDTSQNTAQQANPFASLAQVTPLKTAANPAADKGKAKGSKKRDASRPQLTDRKKEKEISVGNQDLSPMHKKVRDASNLPTENPSPLPPSEDERDKPDGHPVPDQVQGPNVPSNQAAAAQVNMGHNPDPHPEPAQDSQEAETDAPRNTEGPGPAPLLPQAPAGEANPDNEEDRMLDEEEMEAQAPPPPPNTGKETSPKNADSDSPFAVYDPSTHKFYKWDLIRQLPPESLPTIVVPNTKDRGTHLFTCLMCGGWFTQNHKSCFNTYKKLLKENKAAAEERYAITIPDEVQSQGISYRNNAKPVLEQYLGNDRPSSSSVPFEWNFEFLATLEPDKMFSSPGTLDWLPKDTTPAFSQILRDIIPAAIKKKPGAFQAILLLPRLVAPKCLTGKAATSKVLENISLFRAGQFEFLWNRPTLVIKQGSFNPLKRCKTLARAANTRGALKALSSRGVLDPSKCYDALLNLHPDGPELVPPPSSSPTPTTSPMTLQSFTNTIIEADWKKAADALGWKMDFVKVLSEEAIQALFAFCSQIVRDPTFIPDPIKPYFFGARLIPLAKKEGGVRPIAIGTIFHKLISSSIMAHIKHELPGTFAPVQFGVGFAGGAENVVHGVRNALTADSERILVSLDLTNAFNSVSRIAFLEEIRTKFPSLLCWTWQSYGKPATLLVRDQKPILSKTGVRQGDPMGPFLFCLAIQHALTSVTSEKVLSFTYMDDIYLVGHYEELAIALATLEDLLSALSLRINFAKSYATKKVMGLSREIPVKGPDDNPLVMKSPLFIRDPINAPSEATRKAIEMIPQIDDTQIALILLRQINNGTLTYTLRTAPPKVTGALAQKLMNSIKDALTKVLSTTKTQIDKAHKRIFLPFGPGLGFTDLEKIAEPAFQASLLQASFRLNKADKHKFPIPSFPEKAVPNEDFYITALRDAFQHTDLLDDHPKLQHFLVEQTKSERFDKVYNSLNDTNKKIVDSTKDCHASGWLHALPTEPALTFPSNLMRLAVKLFLDINTGKNNSICSLCHHDSEDFTKHALTCPAQKAVIHRHELVKNCVSDLCRAATLPAAVEPSPFGFKKDKNGKDFVTYLKIKKDQRRLDLIISGVGPKGGELGVDVSVANPFAESVVDKVTPLAAAREREQEKINKYSQDCRALGMSFSPFVMDAYGGIPDVSYRQVLLKLTSKIKDYTPANWAAPTAETYWLQRVSIALWSGNAYKARLVVNDTPYIA